jgi:poly(3-hydroxybutyrate) depolymerase
MPAHARGMASTPIRCDDDGMSHRWRAALLVSTLVGCGNGSAPAVDTAEETPPSTGGVTDAATAAVDAHPTPSGDGSSFAGCGHDLPAGGATESGGTYYAANTITTARSDLFDYALFVPKSYSPSRPVSLLIDWHPGGQDGPSDRSGFQWDIELTFKAIFVYPSEPTKAWDTNPNGVDVPLFDALLEKMLADFCIDPRRVFVIGYSSGGCFSNALACVRGDKIRAAAPESCKGPSGPCKGPVAWFGTHGTLDGTYPDGQKSRDFWVAENGCDPTPVPYDPQPTLRKGELQPYCVKYNGCKAGYPVAWCTDDSGHATIFERWPHYVAQDFFDALP